MDMLTILILPIHEPKSFCTTKETINKMKWQIMEWEKIVTNYISDWELVFKIYKELTQLNSKRKKKKKPHTHK